MKELLVRITCDYCGEKLVSPADQPVGDLAHWIIVAIPEGEPPMMSERHFCKRLCAVNYLRNAGPVVIPATEL